ncbi:hypothetical protein BDR26DRAFT_860385 [Obelidium mucronatum]|nr:hypothetical protein BDR26DRAFT_860385 [Obelidium mucronatum]
MPDSTNNLINARSQDQEQQQQQQQQTQKPHGVFGSLDPTHKDLAVSFLVAFIMGLFGPITLFCFPYKKAHNLTKAVAGAGIVVGAVPILIGSLLWNKATDEYCKTVNVCIRADLIFLWILWGFLALQAVIGIGMIVFYWLRSRRER